MSLVKRIGLGCIVALAWLSEVNAGGITGTTWAVVGITVPSSPQRVSDARIFVTITNPTSSVQAVSEQYLCQLVDLIVRDSTGMLVSPKAKNCPRFGVSRPNYHYSLAPGETWKGRSEEQAGQKLSAWGYSLPPGTYLIEAFPSESLYYDPSGASPPPTKPVTLVLQ